jgi:DMSO/TMAO reductase YedYZ molybdopterin-dependent catalytic subunit
MKPSRRVFLQSAVTSGAGLLLPRHLFAADAIFGPSDLPQGFLDTATLENLPGKIPLIRKSFRPPNFETPLSYFEQAFTPNNAFFVRYHAADIPQVNAENWRLTITGDAATKSIELSLDDLKTQFEQVEINALCMCSGNRRGLFQPHVAGVQWGHGAMGNARWKGVRLKDVLTRAEPQKSALEVGMNGADRAVIDSGPDYVKSIPIWKALDENTLIAFEMNGEPLPHWNGFPARLVVPGWTATYWMKHLTSLNISSKPVEGFWMKPGYRIPKGKFPLVQRFVTQDTEVNTPITEMVVNSLFTNLVDNAKFEVGVATVARGVAWDGGYGLASVEVSTDNGETWRRTQFGPDLGKFSWRQWNYRIQFDQPGKQVLMARATNRIGATQTFELIANPAGYHHNVMQRINVDVVA